MSSDISKNVEKEDSTDVNSPEELEISDNSKKDSKKNEECKTPHLLEKSSPESKRSLSKKRKQIVIEHDKNEEDSPSSSDDISSRKATSPVKSTYQSSLCLTPDGTPTSHSTPDASERPRFKRSLTDQYSHSTDGRSPLNHSWSSSTYCTPGSLPSEFGYSRKRSKSRWSDSRDSSYFGYSRKRSKSRWSDSRDSSYFNKSHVSDTSDGFQPELVGYQLVGDSQFCRFGQQLLGLQRIHMPNSSGRIGICVSGQTITDLHRRVKEKAFPIAEKIILMIGTNDFLRNVDVSTMCSELSCLIDTLQETVTEIVLLTLPPIPKLEMKQHRLHFMAIDKYNNYIRSLEDGEKIRIADISPLYSTPPPHQKCRMNLFELFFNGRQRRQDLIHLNRNGLEKIRKYILEHFF